MPNKTIEEMPREDLLRIIDMYAKNGLAMDGVWFQSIEHKFGMDEAIEHDENAWRVFAVAEAERIRKFLNLQDNAGIDGLRRALALRMNANINQDEIIVEGNTLIYRTIDCRVQTARARKELPFHPCKSVGIIEYSGFARAIDNRFTCETISCYPEITDKTCSCSWKFTLVI